MLTFFFFLYQKKKKIVIHETEIDDEQKLYMSTCTREVARSGGKTRHVSRRNSFNNKPMENCACDLVFLSSIIGSFFFHAAMGNFDEDFNVSLYLESQQMQLKSLYITKKNLLDSMANFDQDFARFLF